MPQAAQAAPPDNDHYSSTHNTKLILKVILRATHDCTYLTLDKESV